MNQAPQDQVVAAWLLPHLNYLDLTGLQVMGFLYASRSTTVVQLPVPTMAELPTSPDGVEYNLRSLSQRGLICEVIGPDPDKLRSPWSPPLSLTAPGAPPQPPTYRVEWSPLLRLTAPGALPPHPSVACSALIVFTTHPVENVLLPLQLLVWDVLPGLPLARPFSS